MDKMKKVFRIMAEIQINEAGGRTWPVKTGYRPGFAFIEAVLTSGSINLINEERLLPGQHGIVEISFISNQLLGDILRGSVFKFYEGPIEIGKGKVLKVIGWVETE